VEDIVVSYARNTKTRNVLKVLLSLVIADSPIVMAPAVKLDYQSM
jgi:hypothetical protein